MQRLANKELEVKKSLNQIEKIIPVEDLDKVLTSTVAGVTNISNTFNKILSDAKVMIRADGKDVAILCGNTGAGKTCIANGVILLKKNKYQKHDQVFRDDMDYIRTTV